MRLTVPHNQQQESISPGRCADLPDRHTEPSTLSWNTLQSIQQVCRMIHAKQRF